MIVRELMTSHPVVVLAADSIATAARLMRDREVGMIPVVDDIDDMRLTGVITDRDIATRCVASGHAQTCSVAEHMTRSPLQAVKPADDMGKVTALMRGAKVRRVLVVDDNGRLVGVVSQADLATSVQMQELRLIESTLAAISAPRRRPANHLAVR